MKMSLKRVKIFKSNLYRFNEFGFIYLDQFWQLKKKIVLI